MFVVDCCTNFTPLITDGASKRQILMVCYRLKFGKTEILLLFCGFEMQIATVLDTRKHATDL